MKHARLLLALALLPLLPLAAQKPTDTLTQEEFKAAGLHKLSPAELATLNQLLTRPAPETSATPAPQSQPRAATPPLPPPAANTPSLAPSAREDLYGKEQVAIDTRKAPKKIESRLQGTFNGWYGSTTFKLENGQIWMQRIKEVQKYSPSENPKVTVFKSLGGYRLRIEGYRQTCPVKRIK